MECAASLELAQSTRWLATMLMSLAPAVVAIRFASASDSLVVIMILLFGRVSVIQGVAAWQVKLLGAFRETIFTHASAVFVSWVNRFPTGTKHR